jgi:HD-like signal output (HDOD) protein/CheY-like chemotaxis protein
VKRIVFVDDEPLILDGLRDALRKQRSRWEMSFATSGQAALDEFTEHPADVIVSDMRMPGMDGAMLLAQIRDRFPMTSRVLLTGQASRLDLLRAIPVAQEILSKPCPPALLCQAIERVLSVQDLLTHDKLKTLVGGIHRLPSLPIVYRKLTAAMQRDTTSMAELGGILAEDPALSARVLSVVNSSYWGSSKPTTSITSAVQILGLEVIRALVLGKELFLHDAVARARSLTLRNLPDSALHRAHLARQFVNDRELADLSYSAALLIDIGQVVLAGCLGEAYDALLARAETAGQPIHELEQQELGFTHADAGGYLLARWGLPPQVVELVAAHNAPALLALQENKAARAIHVADKLVTALRARAVNPLADIEPAIRAHPDVESQLAVWLAMAEAFVAQP